jgi:ABC-type multidrug transport system ATPase subunit
MTNAAVSIHLGKIRIKEPSNWFKKGESYEVPINISFEEGQWIHLRSDSDRILTALCQSLVGLRSSKHEKLEVHRPAGHAMVINGDRTADPVLRLESYFRYQLKLRGSSGIGGDVLRILKLWQLESLSGRSLEDLTYLQKLRLKWAIASVTKPSLLIVEEGFLGLNSEQLAAAKELIESILSANGIVLSLSTSTPPAIADKLLDADYYLREMEHRSFETHKTDLQNSSLKEVAEAKETPLSAPTAVVEQTPLAAREGARATLTSAFRIRLAGTSPEILNELRKNRNLSPWTLASEETLRCQIEVSGYENAQAWLRALVGTGILVSEFSSTSFNAEAQFKNAPIRTKNSSDTRL